MTPPDFRQLQLYVFFADRCPLLLDLNPLIVLEFELRLRLYDGRVGKTLACLEGFALDDRHGQGDQLRLFRGHGQGFVDQISCEILKDPGTESILQDPPWDLSGPESRDSGCLTQITIGRVDPPIRFLGANFDDQFFADLAKILQRRLHLHLRSRIDDIICNRLRLRPRKTGGPGRSPGKMCYVLQLKSNSAYCKTEIRSLKGISAHAPRPDLQKLCQVRGAVGPSQSASAGFVTFHLRDTRPGDPEIPENEPFFNRCDYGSRSSVFMVGTPTLLSWRVANVG